MNEIRDLKSFAEAILEEIREKSEGMFSSRLIENVKNNGVKQLGITISSDKAHPQPCVYLKGYYDEYKKGMLDLNGCVKVIFHAIMKARSFHIDFDVEGLSQWDKVRHMIRAKLINTEMNKYLLGEIPSRNYMDLSIVYYISVGDDEKGNGSILIQNKHMALWNKSEEALYQTVCENRRASEDTVFFDIKRLLPSFLVSSSEEPHMFVLTNKKRYFGAAEVMDSKVLRNVYERIGEFIVLPSSVHELIIIKDDKIDCYDRMAAMVKEINADQVAPDERLSDHVYVYDKDLAQLKVAA